MKFIKPIAKGVLMFLVSAIIVGSVVIINWRRTVLKVTIGGEIYHFESANGLEKPSAKDNITEVVYRSDSGSHVTVRLTGNYIYDPYDAYSVEIKTSTGKLIHLNYLPNQSIITIVNAANSAGNFLQPIIPDKVVDMTFYYGRRDITGFTEGAVIENLHPDTQELIKSEALPTIDAGNTIISSDALGLSEEAQLSLESITEFRNYKPFGKAIEPAYFWIPVFVFVEYILMGVFNITRDIYGSIRRRSKKQFTF